MEKELTKEQQKLVEDNIGLVGAFISKHVCWADSFSNVYTRDDIYQEGCMGLIKAAMGYDPGRGTAFSTYAYRAIQSHISRMMKASINIRDHEGEAPDIIPSNSEDEFSDAEFRADMESEAAKQRLVGGIDIFEVYRLHQEGYSCRELGIRYNRSSYWMSLLIRRAEKALVG